MLIDSLAYETNHFVRLIATHVCNSLQQGRFGRDEILRFARFCAALKFRSQGAALLQSLRASAYAAAAARSSSVGVERGSAEEKER